MKEKPRVLLKMPAAWYEIGLHALYCENYAESKKESKLRKFLGKG